MVIFEKRGALRKYAGLKTEEYVEADLIVQPFLEGSIRIPLLNDAYDWLGAKFNEILHDPYQTAAQDVAAIARPLDAQVPAAVNRALQLPRRGHTQQDLIRNQAQREQEYLTAAVLQEINQLISPLRSNIMTDNETITLKVQSDNRQTDYPFNRGISKRFNNHVTAKRLGPETLYTGRLIGLGQRKTGRIKYQGQFVSEVAGDEMNLLIPSAEQATQLNAYNLTNVQFSFWACPVTTFGAFDERRGDIVFLAFSE